MAGDTDAEPLSVTAYRTRNVSTWMDALQSKAART